VIDIQTFMLALGVGNTAFALLMAGYMRGAAPNAGLRTWMWARLSSGLAQICCWAAPHAGLRIAEELAAFGWVGGVALEVASYCVFFGFRNWQHKLVPASAAALVAVAVAAMAQVSREQMMQVVAVLVALFASGAAAILLRPQADAPLLQRIIGANDALFAIAIWIWIWMAVANGGVGTLDANPVYGFVYLASYLLMIVNGFGFLLLSKLKDDQRMQRLATIDGLTDMLNRRAFFERAERARQQAVRLRKPIALMMLDLDHFKQLNDSFGHACGDQALRLFADTARASLRENDVMGRLGGEEFALAMPGTSLAGAQYAAERLRVAVAEAPAPACAATYRMTVSIGLVMLDPDEELTAALARADHALYTAKTGGRNRVEIDAPVLKRA